MMPLHELTEFLRLSSALNYNLSASSITRYNVLIFIVGRKQFNTDKSRDRDEKAIAMEALNYLFKAYQEKRRRLGPLAVLHPLRATALYARVCKKINMIDLVTLLFHDVLEDTHSKNFDPVQWKELEVQLDRLLQRLDPEDESILIKRLNSLTIVSGESYYQYITRLLSDAKKCPELVQFKLSDRLDNTLDMRITLNDPMEGIDFFEEIFQLMFVKNYPGLEPDFAHTPATAMNGAKRLYQLFKNTILLSLIRKKKALVGNKVSELLFEAVTQASLKEAQRNFLHLITHHYRGTEKQRLLLLDAMKYCYSGRSTLVTKPYDGRLLDGLFTTYFGYQTKDLRNQKLDELYQDKALMIQATIAFIVIFFSFLNDPSFYVRGISSEGIDPI